MRIGDGFHRFGKLIGLYGRRAVMLPPGLEEFRDALAMGIVGLECFDALDGIATPEGEERIATPFCPGLEASEGLATCELLSHSGDPTARS